MKKYSTLFYAIFLIFVHIILAFIISIFFSLSVNCCGKTYPHSEIVVILNYATAISVFIPAILLILSNSSKKHEKLRKIAWFFYLVPIIIFIVNINVRDYIQSNYEPYSSQWEFIPFETEE